MQQPQQRRLVPLALALFPLLPMATLGLACGGGGGGGDDVLPATVGFPLSGAVTDADSMTISGTSIAEPTSTVRVGGVDATSTDGNATWTAKVALAPGDNSIEIEIVDQDGNASTVNQVLVRRRILLRAPGAIEVDPDRDVAWFVDEYENALYVLNPFSGEIAVASSDDVGTGTPLSLPKGLVATPGSSIVYVLESGTRKIIAVDPMTGDRDLLALSGDVFTVQGEGGIELDPATGLLIVAAKNGLFLVDPVTETVKESVAAQTSFGAKGFIDVAVNDATGEVYVIEERDVKRFDPAAGTLVTVASNSVGKGTSLSGADALDIDPGTGDVFVLRGGSREIVRVDPATGDRAVIIALGDDSFLRDLAFEEEKGRLLMTDIRQDGVHALEPVLGAQVEPLVTSRLGAGPLVSSVEDIELENGRLFYLESSRYSINELDLGSADRRVLSGKGRGAGIDFEDIYGLAVDLEAGRMYATDLGGALLNLILEVDLATGNRRILAEPDQPNGYEWPEEVELLPDGKLVILDTDLDGLFELDPETGAQRPITLGGDGKGAVFLQRINELTIDPAGNRVLVSDEDSSEGSIKAVDLATGIRTVVSGLSVGSGPTLEEPEAMALDAQNGRLFVVDDRGRKIVAIDLESGDRTLVSGDGRGTGPELESIKGLAWDAARGLLLTHSTLDDALLGISIDSGDRVILAK